MPTLASANGGQRLPERVDTADGSRGGAEATIHVSESGSPRRSPEDRHTVLPEHAVGGNDREVVFKRLRDEESIERIPMAEGQLRDSNNLSELASVKVASGR